jgi:hypothetical protein
MPPWCHTLVAPGCTNRFLSALPLLLPLTYQRTLHAFGICGALSAARDLARTSVIEKGDTSATSASGRNS